MRRPSRICEIRPRRLFHSLSWQAMPDFAQRSMDSSLPPNVTGTVVTVGTFDGVHRGHLDVLEKLVARAGVTGMPSVLVSFGPHPLEVVNPNAAPPLLTSL